MKILTKTVSCFKAVKSKISTLPLYASIPIHWLLIPAIANTALNLFYFTTCYTESNHDFGGMLFSYLFSFLFYAFLLTLCRRATIATPILCGLYFLLGYGNYIKMVVSGMNPLFISDLLFVTDAESIAVMVGYSNLGGIVLAALGQTILFFLVLALLILLAFYLDYRIPSLKARFITLGASLLVLLLIFIPIRPLHSAAYSLFFGEKAGHDPTVYYFEKGFLSGIVGQYWNSHPPVEDTKKEANEILASLPETSQGDWGKPNVIAIFSESFFDVSKWSDITFDREVTPNYTALKEKGISFSMLSPTIGGLSCNSEYQLLANGNLAYYPLGCVPYTMHYLEQNEARYQYPTIIREFNQNGYHTEIVSTWPKNLCNCDRVYESMGLDEFIYDYGEEIKGLYYSDKTVGDMIKKTLAEKERGTPLFFLTQTSQAHMPYYYDKYDEYDVSILSSPLNEVENGIMQSYVQGIYDADIMLADVYAYIQTLDEPTVLVFFGDHLPTLTDCGRNLFDKLSYFNTEDALLNEARRYTTDGLILANFELTDDIDYIGQDLLFPYLLSKTSAELSPYYRYLVSTVDTLPALGTFAAYGKDGTLYRINELPDSMKAVYEKRRILQNALYYSE